MSVLVRFAPSPTGYLHVGNIRTALINFLYAKAHGGQFMLRLDDTDVERSKKEYETAIEDDLKWLGFEWDIKARQLERLERYNGVFLSFKEQGLIYPCYETLEELSLKRKSLLAQGKPPLYDRSALRLSRAECEVLEAEGRKPHWRFKLNNDKAVTWQDMVRGEVCFQGSFASDPVLWRADGYPVYTIASCVDDADYKITHIIRGEDHVANTAVQVQVFEALGNHLPIFGHLPLIADAEGGGFSKRLGSLSVGTLREQGLEPMALNNVLAKLGTGEDMTPHLALPSLIKSFDIGQYGRSTPKFNILELEHMNEMLMHHTSFDLAWPKLNKLGLEPMNAHFWEAIHQNIKKISDAGYWHDVCFGKIQIAFKEEQDYLQTALILLPQGTFDENTWGLWTAALKEKTGRKGKDLFLPLRQVLTGKGDGPEMKKLLVLMQRQTVEQRLKQVLS
jgi:glutamyl-tRNA synthetase